MGSLTLRTKSIAAASGSHLILNMNVLKFLGGYLEQLDMRWREMEEKSWIGLQDK